MINYLHRSKTKRDIQTLHYALVKAYHHKSDGLQTIWAVATDSRNNILAEAGNSYSHSNALQRKFANGEGGVCALKLYAHAEMLVLDKLRKNHKKATKLFVARSDRQQRAMLSCPCPICTEAIRELSDIKKVFWTEKYQ